MLAPAAGVVLLLGAAGCAEAPAPAPPATGAAAVLEPEAEAALRRMSASIAAAPAFTVRLRTLRETSLPTGQRVLLGAQGAIVAQRPDRLHAFVGGDTGNFGLWYDGAQATLLDPASNTYGATPLTGDLVSVATWLQDRIGIALPVRPLLAADPLAMLLGAGPTTGGLLGPTLVGSAPARHYAFRNPAYDWEIWLADTPAALPLRVSVVERTAQGPVRSIIEFEDWTLAPRLPPRVFSFVPPRGATRTDLVPLPATTITPPTDRRTP